MEICYIIIEIVEQFLVQKKSNLPLYFYWPCKISQRRFFDWCLSSKVYLMKIIIMGYTADKAY